MRAHPLTFPASPALQTVRSSGRGYLSLITISHSEASPQAVVFYRGDGVAALARYIVDPAQSPYTLAFQKGYQLWFTSGLKLLTGNCVVNLVAVY